MSRVYAVGIGPGSREMLTEEAAAVLSEADLIIGYQVYAEQVRSFFPEKEIRSTPMKKELSRCREALSEARNGNRVAVVCSGDAGVYGMAGLLYELLPEYPGVELQVVPGVTAALSGAAVLGAPLANDFCVISLSDLLTPWEEIEKRLNSAGAGDFAICLYNPMSRSRTDHLRRACEILMEHKDPETVCGFVRNIGREGQEKKLLSLRELAGEAVDMFTTVFIGTRQTEIIGDAMVTRRGYQKEAP